MPIATEPPVGWAVPPPRLLAAAASMASIVHHLLRHPRLLQLDQTVGSHIEIRVVGLNGAHNRALGQAALDHLRHVLVRKRLLVLLARHYLN